MFSYLIGKKAKKENEKDQRASVKDLLQFSIFPLYRKQKTRQKEYLSKMSNKMSNEMNNCMKSFHFI